MSRIALVDYHKGNIMSVARALEDAGADLVITDDPSIVGQSDAIVLPGVGAFADASDSLRTLGLWDAVRDAAMGEKPFLGICLGLHLLFESGREGPEDALYEGLGVMSGIVSKLPDEDANGRAFKIPHVGWNSVEMESPSPLFDGIRQGEHFYFTHSFAAPDGDLVIATTEHSKRFPSAVQKGSTFAVQFHPEKSSDAGLMLLRNFVDIAQSSN